VKRQSQRPSRPWPCRLTLSPSHPLTPSVTWHGYCTVPAVAMTAAAANGMPAPRVRVGGKSRSIELLGGDRDSHGRSWDDRAIGFVPPAPPKEARSVSTPDRLPVGRGVRRQWREVRPYGTARAGNAGRRAAGVVCFGPGRAVADLCDGHRWNGSAALDDQQFQRRGAGVVAGPYARRLCLRPGSRQSRLHRRPGTHGVGGYPRSGWWAEESCKEATK